MTEINRYVFKYVVNANMYIVTEDDKALVVDPHYSQEAERFLNEHGIKDVTILLTHEHFDHTCGIPWFMSHYDVSLICQSSAMNVKRQRHFNRAICLTVMIEKGVSDELAEEIERVYPPYTYAADMTFEDSLKIEWEGHNILLESVPGHSPASCIITLDNNIVFTGDSLVPGCEPTIRWPYSDKELYYSVTLPRLLEISPDTVIYPGHGNAVEMGRIQFCNGKFEIKEA